MNKNGHVVNKKRKKKEPHFSSKNIKSRQSATWPTLNGDGTVMLFLQFESYCTENSL